MNIQWSQPDSRWYFGVHCRKCGWPILFAVDHNHSDPGAQAPPAGMLVLTCSIDDCKHKADYTGAVVLRLQKSPGQSINDTPSRIKTSGKNGKRKA